MTLQDEELLKSVWSRLAGGEKAHGYKDHPSDSQCFQLWPYTFSYFQFLFFLKSKKLKSFCTCPYDHSTKSKAIFFSIFLLLFAVCL